MSHWAAQYIGLPYVHGGRTHEGVDCWGLLRLIYIEQHRIELPLLTGIVERPVIELCNEISHESFHNWTEVPDPVDGDAVAMGLKKVVHHVGVWADVDGGKVIHNWQQSGSVAETLRSLKIKGFRTIRFFRYGIHS